MSLESLFQHIIFSEHLAEENRRLMRQGRALAGASGLGAGGLEAEGIRRQWAEPGGGGGGGQAAFHVEGRTAERCLITGPRNGDSRKMDVF